ncbi:MAG: hypothetical protein Ta2F_11730 [Termitinemataceae bacterium]|nr:MAG: hypothetical protein Ta2F_11730 [Termitinemataceae bacterium]
MAYKNNNKRKQQNIPMGMMFWVVFFVVVAALFAINLPKIKKTLDATHFADHILNRDTESVENPDDMPLPDITFEVPHGTGNEGGTVSVGTLQDDGSQVPADQNDLQTEESSAGQVKPASTVVASPPSKPQAERERTVYLVKVDGTGMVFTTPVQRRLPASDSPMIDVLNVLIQGAQAGEQKQGLTSLIPAGTKILNARVNGSTATINFSESFMFNNYGAEGYIAQLRQIVWTATEFPNVDEVQILIEGQKVDYLGESINIGRPISRNSL